MGRLAVQMETMTNLAALPSGTELVNDFRIDQVLGAGGFGITYLAQEIALDRRVTIKEYFPSDYAARVNSLEALPRSKECGNDYRWGLDRFISEAQTLAKFNHPHIVRVYRYFRANNTGYMVLHFEEGQSFKNWLKGLGRAPRQKELDAIVEPLLEALDLIHKQDFLHRDIAPDNIIIRKDGTPVLIDFGSARQDIAAQSKTVSALVKPGYSPYEQYAETSSQQGPWTDIYALGATLYHAATGKRPPDAPSRMVNDDYRPARSVALSSYRPRFLKAIDAALTLDVAKRPRSIGAWRGELLIQETPPPKPAKQGWLTRRSKKGKKNKAGTPSSIEPSASTARAVDADGATVPIPPPPDAPGPKGGIVDFVDALKKRPKREPLAVALARVNAPAEGLDRFSEEQRTTIETPKGDAGLSNQETFDATREITGLDASPHARTQIYSPGDGAEHKLAPRADKYRQKPVKRSKPRPSLKVPKEAGRKASWVKRAKADKKADKKALAPIRNQGRRPARPRPMPSRSRYGWTSFFAKVVAFAGIGGIWIASQGKLPSINLTPLLNNLHPTVQGHDSSRSLTRRRTETAAIRKRKPSRPVSSPVRTSSARGRPPPPLNPLLRQLSAHESPAMALAYSSNGKTLVTASKDQTLKVWDALTGTLRKTIGLAPAPTTALALQGQLAAISHEDGLIEVFNLNTGLKQASLRRNEASVWSLAFTNQPGRLAAASHDWKIALWDVKQPQAPVHIFEGHSNSVQAVAASPDHPFLVTGGADRRIKLWNLDTLDLVRTYPRQNDFITALAFAPDGNKFASATLKGDVRIWSTRSRRQLRHLRGHKGAVEGLSFSPDGKILTSAGSDGTIRIWSVRRGRTIKTLASHTGSVNAVGFAPDGQRFASVGDDGLLRVWSTFSALSLSSRR